MLIFLGSCVTAAAVGACFISLISKAINKDNNIAREEEEARTREILEGLKKLDEALKELEKETDDIAGGMEAELEEEAREESSSAAGGAAGAGGVGLEKLDPAEKAKREEARRQAQELLKEFKMLDKKLNEDEEKEKKKGEDAKTEEAPASSVDLDAASATVGTSVSMLRQRGAAASGDAGAGAGAAATGAEGRKGGSGKGSGKAHKKQG